MNVIHFINTNGTEYVLTQECQRNVGIWHSPSLQAQVPKLNNGYCIAQRYAR